MSLTAGTRLGPYEILGLLGAGGMGEVYKARDTRLDRAVAIKILPADISADPDRRARFEREAKTIAGLAHPHICTLHDVGEQAGSIFLVMEYLDGDTLAHRLEKGPLSIDQALTIAIEIADALTAAHRHGIVHRDLKPANVILTKGGAKLLDFGVAKLTGHGDQAATAHLASVPTRASLTGEGVIVGTLQYMAPEQLEGRPADARTDLWALGAILYEMVTGKRAFEASSAASLVGAIMEREPTPLSTLQPLTPPGIDRLVRQCLAKGADDRPDTAHDLANDLRWLRESSSAGALTGVRPASIRWRMLRSAALVLVGVLLSAGLTSWLWARWSPLDSSARRRMTFAVVLPASDVLQDASGVAVAPDGSRIAYVAVRNGVRRLFVRTMDRLDVAALDGTEGADAPFFSPDGQWLGFFATGALKKVRIAGGEPVTICQVGYRRGATWTDEDVIIFGSDLHSGLMRVSASGGAPAPLTVVDEKEWSHRWPEALPGGSAVVFTIAAEENPQRMQLAVLDVESRQQRTLLQGSFPRFVPPGYLTFVRGGALWAIGFDPRRLTISGEPVRAVDIPEIYIGGFAEYGISRDGTLVSRPPADEGGQLTWVDRDGRATRITERAGFTDPRLSPDGRRIAASSDTGAVWVYDLDRSTFARITSDSVGSMSPASVGSHGSREPAWAPDGKRIMFVQDWVLYAVPADGGAPPVRISPANRYVNDGSWLSDGATLVYAVSTRPHESDIWIQPPSGPAAPIVATPDSERHAAFSPDGRWLAYRAGASSELTQSGGTAVYVQAYPTGPRLRVSTTDGGPPCWARNGRELSYVSNRGEMMSVPVDPKSSTVFGRPQVLFGGAFSSSFDVDLEGRRFLITTRRQTRRLIVSLNWLEELRSKLLPIR